MADLHNVESFEKAALHRRASGEGAAEGETHAEPVHPMLRLQSQVGNANIARWLAQRAAPDDEDIQAKHETVGIEGGAAGPETTASIQSLRGGGSPLDQGMRSSMEASFGTSFADVRVHSNDQADTLNRRLTARAFTTGNDIFLRRDASPGDARLMAHELTHVVQQRSMSGGAGGLQVGAADDGHERHADAVADAVTSSAPVAATAQREGAPEDDELQREAAPEDEELQREAAPEDEELQRSFDLAQRASPDEEEEPA
jgi:Domain of unknown function (DUF4157)